MSKPIASVDVSYAAPSSLPCGEASNWVQPAMSKLEALGRLQRDWDSHDGLPLSPRSRQCASDAIAWLQKYELPVPAVVLGSDGSVHLEWQANGKELEIGFGDDESAEYLKVDAHGCIEEGKTAGEETRKTIISLVEWLKHG